MNHIVRNLGELVHRCNAGEEVPLWVNRNLSLNSYVSLLIAPFIWIRICNGEIIMKPEQFKL